MPLTRTSTYQRRLNAEIATAIVDGRNSFTNECRQYRTVLDLAQDDEEYGLQATVPELVDQVKTFLFAGHDTTASTISWIFYYLSLYPEIHAKIRAEHDTVLGPFVDTPSLAEKLSSDPKLLARLEYTLAVLKEVLRIRPVTDGARQGPPGYVIRTANGIEFDVSDLMIVSQHQALHTDPSVWGPTASQFDPERFMPGKSIPVGYMPFSTRPKDCVGRNLAYLEVGAF
jgi:cytochrome P450